MKDCTADFDLTAEGIFERPSSNAYGLMEYLAGILNLQVVRPVVIGTTALGAAYLAGLQLGLFKNLAEIEQRGQLQQILLRRSSRSA